MTTVSPKDKKELQIFRGDIKAGTLGRIENGCQFEFAKEFLDDTRHTGLSYRMPKSKIPYKLNGTNLHPFFAGLLPEGLRFKSLVRAIKTSEDDLFTLFAAVGSRVIGDVFVQSDNEPVLENTFPKPKDINFYEYFFSTLNKNNYAAGEDAFAGVQEKISASMIHFPVNIAKETKAYILKLNPKDKPRLIENELQCMRLALKCGIDIPKLKIVWDKDDQAGLLIERFDRIWDETNKRSIMVHQEDGCQILNRYPADKYNLSLNDIVKGIVEVATAPAATILKLLRIYCYSYLIGNGDLHAKNISLMTHIDHPIIDLTPAYDLISTYVYGDQKMAMKMDGKDDNITKKMVIEFGRRFGINEKAIVKMIDSLIQDFRDHIHLLQSIPESEKSMNHLMKTAQKRVQDLTKF